MVQLVYPNNVEYGQIIGGTGVLMNNWKYVTHNKLQYKVHK